MEARVLALSVTINWLLINKISQIDRFDAEWSGIERLQEQDLKQLRYVATISSVGASTRIEGSKLSDPDVEKLLAEITIQKLDDRDEQEVAGYFNVLDLIVGSFQDVDVTEGNVKNLHNMLLGQSAKDDWHRGDYKQQSNVVEATFPDGSRQVIFETTPPGFPTQDAMRALIDWYRSDQETHPLVKCALFTYEFLSIHPFQDGNGRLSRLLSTLTLLQNGYRWIQYISFEHEIERRKTDYYRILRTCQAARPHENVSEWIHFYFDCLLTIQKNLMAKLNPIGSASGLSPRDNAILSVIRQQPGIKSGALSKRMNIPQPTMKKILADLHARNLIQRFGTGAGTNYAVT